MDQRVEKWCHSYQELAEQVVEKHVHIMQKDFPDERFPVRPPYRKATYNCLLKIIDELNEKMHELLEESPDETDQELQEQLMAMQEHYEHKFSVAVRKTDPHSIIETVKENTAVSDQ